MVDLRLDITYPYEDSLSKKVHVSVSSILELKDKIKELVNSERDTITLYRDKGNTALYFDICSPHFDGRLPLGSIDWTDISSLFITDNPYSEFISEISELLFNSKITASIFNGVYMSDMVVYAKDSKYITSEENIFLRALKSQMTSSLRYIKLIIINDSYLNGGYGRSLTYYNHLPSSRCIEKTGNIWEQYILFSNEENNFGYSLAHFLRERDIPRVSVDTNTPILNVLQREGFSLNDLTSNELFISGGTQQYIVENINDFINYGEPSYDEDEDDYDEDNEDDLLEGYGSSIGLPFEKGFDKSETPLYLGMELEVESEDNRRDALEKANNILNVKQSPYCVFSEDGSLDGSRGFEIRTQPAVLHVHKDKLDKFLDTAKSYLNSFNNTDNRCGMHVHIDLKALGGDYNVSKLFMLYNLNSMRKFWHIVAGRGGNSFTEYHDIEKPFGVSNLTNLPDGIKRYNRYNACNISFDHAQTVEIRIFKGTVDKLGVFKNLEIVDASVRYVKRTGVRSLSVESFLMYLYKNKKKYPSVLPWFSRRFRIDNITIEQILEKLKNEDNNE